MTALTVLDDEAQGSGNSGPWLGGDVSPNVSTVSGGAGALFSAGADGVKSVTLNGPAFSVIYKDADGFAQVESVTWSAGVKGADGGTIFTATGDTSNQVAATLRINADGSYSFTLSAPVAHGTAVPFVEENETLSFGFTVTDGDNDTASGTLNIRVNDDTPEPVLSVVLASRVLDDEAQVLFTPTNPGGFWDVSANYSTVAGGAGSLFRIGADGLGSIDVGLPSFSIVYKNAEGFAQTETVQWGAGERSADGTTTWMATGSLSGQAAATLVIRADGSYEFTLTAPVAHGPSLLGENNDVLTFTYLVRDGDGDQAVGSLVVSVNDDTPVAKVVTAATVLDDEAQTLFAGNDTPADGVANVKVATGDAGALFSAGADGVRSVAITGGGFSVIYRDEQGFAQTESVTWNEGVKGADGATVFTATSAHYPAGTPAATLVINADGSYTFTLNAPVAHPAAGSTEENSTISLGVTVTDGDGDSATGSLAISVNDDVPVASNGGTIDLQEKRDGSGAFAASTVEGTLPFDPGADGATVTAVTYRFGGAIMDMDAPGGFPALTSGGEPVTIVTNINPDTKVITLTGTANGEPVFTFVVEPNGEYTFTLKGPIDHPDIGETGAADELRMVFDFTVTDGDGDTSTSWIQVDIRDDGPTTTQVDRYITLNEAQIDADGVSGAHSFNIDFGADGYGKTYFTGQMGFNIGGTMAGNITFNVENGPQTIDEVTSDGQPITFERIDGNTIIGYVGSPDKKIIELKLTDTDTSVTATLFGKIDHIDVNGVTPLDLLRLDATVAFEDGDGDRVTSILRVNINDDKPVVTGDGNHNVSLEENDIAPLVGQPAGTDGTGSTIIDGNITKVDFGADGFGSIAFAGGFNVPNAGLGTLVPDGPGVDSGLTSDNDAILFRLSDDGLVIEGYVLRSGSGEELILRATLNGHDRGYQVELMGNIDHQPGSTGRGAGQSINFVVRASDGDGDYVDVDLSLRVHDDAPVKAHDYRYITLNESDLGAGIESGTAIFENDMGADGFGSAVFTGLIKLHIGGGTEGNVSFSIPNAGDFHPVEQLTSNGVALVFTKVNDTLIEARADGALVLEISMTGTDQQATARLHAPIDHVAVVGGQIQLIRVDATIAFTDGDGDTITAIVRTNINDDGPVAAYSGTETIQEKTNLDGSFAPQEATGALVFNTGADGGGVSNVSYRTTIDQEDGTFPPLTSGGQPIDVTTSLDGLTVTGSVGSTVIFMLEVTNPATGVYTFKLLGPIDHPDAGTNGSETGGADYLRLVFDFTVTDGDGDSTAFNQGTLQIDIRDDGPTVGSVEAPTLYMETFDSGTPAGFAQGGSYGNIETKASGEGGIETKDGTGNYALLTQTASGPYTFFGGPRTDFFDGFKASIDIWLDPDALSSGEGFDYSVAAYRQNGAHLRDFIFHVTKDSSTGQLLVGGSNNTNFDPKENLESGNHKAVSTADWYTFEHVFRDAGDGSLAVDLILKDAAGNEIFTETRNNPADLIASLVGGNGYGWFTNIDVAGGIAVDTVILSLANGIYLNENNPDTVSGSLNVLWGADDANPDTGMFDRKVTFTTGAGDSGLTSGGVAIHYFISADGETLTAYLEGTDHTEEANQIFVVTLSDELAGGYSFTLKGNIDHAEGAGQNLLPITFDFIATDADGDSATGAFTIEVKDGVPVASSLNVTVNEADLANADPSTGHYTASFLGWTLFDFDLIEGAAGSSGSGGDTIDYRIEYGNFAGGLLNTLFRGSVLARGTLADAVDFGADGAAAGGGFVFTGDTTTLDGSELKSNGETVEYTTFSVNGHHLVFGYVSTMDDDAVDAIFAGIQGLLGGSLSGITALIAALGDIPNNPEFRLVFSLEADPAGAFAFRLFDQLDHLTGSGDALSIDFSALFTAVDGDGDSVPLGNGTFTITVNDDMPAIAGATGQFNLLTNGDFSAGGWTDGSWDGGHADDTVGWQIAGTEPDQASVRLEYVNNGYNGMHSSTGGRMVDLGATPGNIAISQTLTGLTVGANYTLSFEMGSPGTAALEVYWNGVKLDLTQPVTGEMVPVTLAGLQSDDHGKGVLTFKEVGYASDNTGTYLANINLAPESAGELPVITGTLTENGEANFDFAVGTDFQFGADGPGSVSFDPQSAVISGPSGIELNAPDISYDSTTGILTVDPGTAFDALSQGEIATLTIPFTVTDGDGDTKSGLYRLTINGTNDAPVITGTSDLPFLDSGLAVETEAHESQLDHLHRGNLEPGSDLDIEIAGALAGSSDDMAAALAAVQEVLGTAPAPNKLADAILYVWDYLDDHYVNGTQFNEAFVRLGVEYAKYLRAGNPPLLDIVAKFTADVDPGGTPDRVQSFHDNLLGNLYAGALNSRFSGDKLDDLIALIQSVDPALLERETYSGDEGSLPTLEDTRAWDALHGYAPLEAGQFSATDVDQPDNLPLQWSASAGTYGRFVIDPTTGEWSYTVDHTRAETQALAEGKTTTETITVTVTDEHGATGTRTIEFKVTGINDGDEEEHSFTVKVSGEDNEITGGSYDDILVGDPDVIETLTGGEGADIFELNAFNDLKDIIADYNGDEGDEIDLSALFEGDSVGEDDITISEADETGNRALKVGETEVATLVDPTGTIKVIIDDETFTLTI